MSRQEKTPNVTRNAGLRLRQILYTSYSDTTTVVTHAEASFASVYYLTIGAAHLEDKDADAPTLKDVTIPAELDSLSLQTASAAAAAAVSSSAGSVNESLALVRASKTVKRRQPWLAIGSITRSQSAGVETAFQAAFEELAGERTCVVVGSRAVRY